MAAAMGHRDRQNYGNSLDLIALDRHASFTFSPLLLHKPSIFNAISPIDSSGKGIDIDSCNPIGWFLLIQHFSELLGGGAAKCCFTTLGTNRRRNRFHQNGLAR
jgi:hypothetical protein